MRGTLHFIAADDLTWMLPLFGPGFIRRNRKRQLDLGLDVKPFEPLLASLQHELEAEI